MQMLTLSDGTVETHMVAGAAHSAAFPGAHTCCSDPQLEAQKVFVRTKSLKAQHTWLLGQSFDPLQLKIFW